MVNANILYRGPLQRSRLSFLSQCIAEAFGPVKLFWLTPLRMTQERIEHFQQFIRQNQSITEWELVDGRVSATPSVLSYLRRLIEDPTKPTIAIGFTALPYASQVAKGKLIWCINGIPEERLLQARTWQNRLGVDLLWRSTRLWKRPDLTVTVSEPMAELVQKRCRCPHTISALNSANLAIFQSTGPTQRLYMTYMGTDAPWQALDDLAKVWAALYQKEPALHFRVISRNEGTRILARGLPESAIEFCSAEAPQDVARFLWQAEAGFLIRKPDIVNRVSFPLKFGEYLAAGAYVVTTDLNWDPGKIVQATGCGVLLQPTQSPEQMAQQILAFREQSNPQSLAKRCQAAVAHLDRQVWVEKLVDAMKQVV